MKYSRFALLFSLLATSPAFAASVIMVQFGSFETSDEANKRLADVKSANAAALGALPTTVREVKLPPDNLTVYRTQAGPLANRADAQALCGKLASNGSECYVVETAVSQVTPAPTQMAAAPKATEAAPSIVPPSAKMGATNTNSSVRIPEVSRSGMTPPPAPVAAPASAEMDKAMDRAASAQKSGDLVTAAAGDTTTVARPSFWSRVNPFSSSEKPAAPKPVDVAAAPKLPEAAPVEPVSAVALAPLSQTAKDEKVEPLKPLPAPGATPEPVRTSTPLAPVAKAPVAPAPTATAPATPIMLPSSAPMNTASADRPRLLPPPAPLNAQDKKMLETPTVRPEPEVLAGPIGGTPAPIAKSTPLAPMPAPVLAPTNGTVKVEEAKRVPVTETPQPPVMVAPVAPAPAIAVAPVAPAVNLLPSSTVGQKTLWAQIGQFNDSEAALTFWDRYRNTHPDFPVVRVRIASSLQQQQHGNDRVWLRVGPFAREGFIRNLCEGLSTTDSDKRCGIVTDMGVAARAGNTPGYLQGSRYKR